MSALLPAVDIHHLSKDFKTSFLRKPIRAVHDVSIQIMPGEVYGLIGPNGSGKSTTMKALLGLVTPTEGRCSIFGKNALSVDSRHHVGFLPENPYFYKHLTGAETLRFYGKLCGIRGAKLEQKITELLQTIGLLDAKDRRIGGYSKGMLQRIGIAQALIHDPRLVILDEPTAGVDPVGSREIRDLILTLKQRGITVFLCSHLLEQVQEVCDQVGIISQGKLIRQGKLLDLIAIEDQTEIVLRNADAELIEHIRTLVESSPKTQWIRCGKPKTTLEQLFLKEIKEEQP